MFFFCKTGEIFLLENVYHVLKDMSYYSAHTGAQNQYTGQIWLTHLFVVALRCVQKCELSNNVLCMMLNCIHTEWIYTDWGVCDLA